MALIDLLDLSKRFQSQKILTTINFHIDQGERIVIVGKNGSGKSTLMKIVQGSLDFDEGERIMRQNTQIKMLDQKPKFKLGHTVREAIEAQLDEINIALKRYDALNSLLATQFDDAALFEEHAAITAFLDHHNAWNLDDKINRVIKEFDLVQYEHQSVDLLSGGEQRRVALAGLLLQKPDILLLDEPTNHLDVYMVEFLEELLLKEKFTLLFISHDRYFIDRLATKTIEIEDATIREFKGGYSNYLEQKQLLLESMQKQHDNLLRLLRRENEWYAKGVRARLKRNEGRKARLLSLREEGKKNPTLIRKVSIELEREQKHFQRDKSVNKQKMLFELENICLKLGEKKLIENLTMRILQKDIIAVVGHNGSGKSTLLRVLLERLMPDSGVLKKGEFTIGYFDQHREMLDDSKNLIETFCPNGGDQVEVQGSSIHVYGYLKNFLFPREHLDKKIGVLSGGEKNRVALALLFTKKVDCLILDEPTNDLDIPTINILEEKLQEFPGAIILVSHDRYFVDKIASKLLVFKGEGVIEEYYQPYTEYLEIEKEFKELEILQTELDSAIPAEPKNKSIPNTKLKLTFKEQHLLKTLPDDIQAVETHIDELNSCLANPVCYEKEGLQALASKLEETQKKYEELSNSYLELLEKEERINAQEGV